MTYSYPELPQGSPPSPSVGAYGAEEVDSFSLGNLTGVLRRRWWIIILVALVVGGFSFRREIGKPEIFESSFQLLVTPPPVEGLNPLTAIQSGGLLTGRQNNQNYFATQIELLKSNTLLSQVWDEIEREDPSSVDGERLSYQQVLSNLSITKMPDADIIVVSYRDKERERVQAVLKKLATAYINYAAEQRDLQDNERLRFVNERLPEFEERVRSLQSELLRLQRENNIFNPESAGENASSRLDTIVDQRRTLQLKIRQLTARKEALEQKTGVGNDQAFALSSLGQSPVYAGLVNSLNEINLRLVQSLTIYTPQSIQVQQLQEEKASILQLIQAEIDRGGPDSIDRGSIDEVLNSTDVGGPKAAALGELANVGIELEVMDLELQELIRAETELREQLQRITTISGQYAAIKQEFDRQKSGLDQLTATRQALEIEITKNYVPWRLISNITLPNKPIDTLPRDILFSTLVGLLAGGAAALLVDKLDPRHHSVEDLRSSYSHTILGYIPLEKELRASIKYGSPLPNEAMQESYARLYSNLFFLKRKRQCHSFVVTSAESGDGKSTTSFFLAQAAAKLGQKVLLVDGDRYFPQKQAWLKLAKITGFGGENTASDGNGVLSTLAANSNGQNGDLPEPLGKNLFYFKVQDDTMTPEQLVSASQNFVVKMNQWKETFDLILIDTPPILGLTDSRLIADQTDGLVVVVRLNKTRKDSLNEAFRELALADLNVIGIVANAITSTSGGYGYYYGRYYNNRYYDRQKLAQADK